MKNAKAILIAAGASLLLGCTNTRPEPKLLHTAHYRPKYSTYVSQLEAKYMLYANRPHTCNLGDETYWSPSMSWFESAIKSYTRSLPRRLKHWSKHWDCNKRARDLQVYLSRKYAKQAKPDDPEGIACFVINYHCERVNSKHAINAIIINGKMRYYDLDLWSFVEPTDKERRTIWYSGD